MRAYSPRQYSAEEEEAEYYRYVLEQEKKMQMAKQAVPSLEYNPKEVKIVSLGINNHTGHSPRESEDVVRNEKFSKFEKYAVQMAADREKTIPESRKPFVRQNYDDQVYQEFTIGRETDANSMFRQKREAQMNYKQQLQADQQVKPVESDRRRFTQRAVSPPREKYLDIGKDEEYEKIVKRRAAIEMRLQNTETSLLNKLTGTNNFNNNPRSPEQQKSARQQVGGPNCDDSAFSRGNDIRKFEDAQYHFIGEHDSDAKQKRLAQMQQYVRQLDSDGYNKQQQSARLNEDAENYSSNNGNNSQNYSAAMSVYNNRQPIGGGTAGGINGTEYVNTSGWTGFNIGGAATGNSLSRVNLDNKAHQQAEYKRQLDLQVMEAEEIARRNAVLYARRELR